MNEQSLNSLLGTLSTKATHASGISKTTGNSKQTIHEKNEFHAGLINSMKDSSTDDTQTDYSSSSDINNIKDNNQIIEMASLGLLNSNDGNQIQLNHDFHQNITIESKALIESGPNLLKDMKETIMPLSDKPISKQSNLEGKSPLDKLTDTIKNTFMVTDRTAASVQTRTDTFLDNNLHSNQGSNLINEQKIFETLNNSNPDKVAAEETGSLQKKFSTNIINKLLETNNNPGNESSKPAIQASRALNRHNLASNAMFEAKDNATGNNAINHNTLLNHEGSINGKIDEHLKGQDSDKILTANTRIKSPSQQGFAKTDPDKNESSIIFDTNSKSADSNSAKSSDNTTITHNNSVNTGDIASSANTSSDNSSFNNQRSDILSEFDINSVSARKNTGPETNFTDTLSQVNNSSKPLGSLSNDVADNIIQSAKLYMEGGKPEIKIQLNPEELGSLKLEFSVDDDILETKITVERSAVKDIIEKDIPRLRELISSADIDVGKLDVSLQEKENDRFGFMDKDFQPNSENNSTQDLSNHEKEHFENEAEEESITKNTGSNQINYLV